MGTKLRFSVRATHTLFMSEVPKLVFFKVIIDLYTVLGKNKADQNYLTQFPLVAMHGAARTEVG